MTDVGLDLLETDRRLLRLISDGAVRRHTPGTDEDRLVTVVVHGTWSHGRVELLRSHGYLGEGDRLTGRGRGALRTNGAPAA